jgi:NAD(P)-dependent dehydrogenase (short-subunit alcohol dehydrogenase family)
MTVLSLAGKVAIVTGAGRGLGRSMARGLARAGAKVVLTAARARDELNAAAAEIAAERGEATVATMLADVADPDACEAVVALALDRFGKLDVLVSNAGRGMKYVSESFMTKPTRFWEMPAETWQMVIATNVNGPFLMARAAMPYFLKAGKGRIINISMNWQTMRRKGFTPYGPSKAALESASMIWAQDLAGTGITVRRCSTQTLSCRP